MTDRINRLSITSESAVLPEMKGKYDLVFYASQRARAILNGSDPLIEGFNGLKNHAVLIALEEFRRRKISFDDVMQSLASPHVELTKEAETTYREDTDEDEEDEDAKIDYKAEEEYED